jgi:processive 1,2-diacylglycerol beta-glucosyltransferase
MSLTNTPLSASSQVRTSRVGRTVLVDIVSGSFGAGHDAAAREIALCLESRGHTTRTWDIVDLMPGHLGRILRAGYLRQIQSFPATWSWTLDRLERHPALARAASRALGSADAALLELAADGADTIVSTHPFASQALGNLRAQGLLTSPVVTYLTDMSVHPFWVHPSVDLHLALNELPAREARDRGARDVRVVRPVVPADFAKPGGASTSASESRHALALPLDQRLVLITGGSCGIGELESTAADIAATGLAVPVVLCGRNHRLLHRIRASGKAIGLGWTDDMPSLLNAVDVVVQNSGGFTSLETLAAGVPILTYRCIAGHGETNARALDQAGLVPWIRDHVDLATGLGLALSTARTGRPPTSWLRRVDIVDAIASRVPAMSS